jgi:hypothetical protein
VNYPEKKGRRPFLGNYKTMMAAADLEQLLKTFVSISKHYKMPLLQEMAEWYLKMNNRKPEV